jgi:hypothetical protein
MAKKPHCWFGRHKWVKRETADGDLYGGSRCRHSLTRWRSLISPVPSNPACRFCIATPVGVLEAQHEQSRSAD